MKITKINFQEGKARVLDMVNGMYCDIAHDHIFHLQNMDLKTELGEVGFLSGLLLSIISEHKQLVTDVNNCECFYDILNLISKYSIFEDCEEIVIGAFLGISIDIYDGEFWPRKKDKFMKKVKEMIETAPSKKEAMDMLETWRLFNGLSESLYMRGREYIREVWN